jgi:uncharacterized membrane protein YqjE
MLHPLLHLIATQPHLLADHAQAYAELAAIEVGEFSAAWKRRAVLLTVAAFCMGLAVVLAGVAVMLWSVLPVSQMQAPWALVAVPGVLVVVSVVCLLAGRSRSQTSAFANLRAQVKSDVLMLREVAAP